MKRTLTESATGTLNSAGKTTLTIGPRYYNESWHVTNIAVSTSSNTNTPSVEIFNGPVPVASFLRGSTYDGSSDSTDIDLTLHMGQKLSARWGEINAGDAGATATLSIYGEQTIGGEE